VVLAGTISLLLAKATLGQVDQMVDTIRQVTEKNMDIRIGVPDSRDEIKKLADSLNDMLARLENSFESQKKFIEDVTHEIKTPLSIMRGEIEYYLEKNPTGEEYKTLLRSNIEEVNRITKIVEDLLLLARFDTHVMQLEMKDIDISILAKEIAEIFAILAQQKSIELVIDAPEKIIISGDRNKLNRLFMNILDNAIKYTPVGGTIRISVKGEDGNVNISVSDSGIGISEENIQNIFNRFYRVDKGYESSGYGLGLCIARSIVEAHQGHIDVQSVLGKGTEFKVTLPVEAQD
jgi:heavy metal sensor kinase